MALLKTIDDVKLYVSTVTTSLKFNDFLPYIKMAEDEYIKKILGPTFYTSIEDAYQNNTLSSAETKLLPLLQAPIANMALMFAIPFFNVQFGSGGITVTNSTTQAPAAQWRIDDLKRAVLRSAHSGFETLLGFLSDNATDYPDYDGSDAQKENLNNFINGAKEFSKHFNIQDSLWIYWNIRAIMNRVETDQVLPKIGQELFEEIKNEILLGTVSANNKKLLEYIRPAVANLTIYDAVDEMALTIDEYGVSVFTSGTTNAQLTNLKNPAPDKRIGILKEKRKIVGEQKLKELTDYLNKNHSTYPLFESSDAYAPDDTDTFENKKDSGYFFA